MIVDLSLNAPSSIACVVRIRSVESCFRKCYNGISSLATSWCSVSMDVSIHVVNSANDISPPYCKRVKHN